MNSVHEPSPNGDSETLPSQKPRSKTQTGCMSPQLAQPAHQARPGRAWPRALRALAPCRSSPSAVSPLESPLACRSCRAPCAPLPRAPRVRPPAARLRVTRPSALRPLTQRPALACPARPAPCAPSSLRAQRPVPSAQHPRLCAPACPAACNAIVVLQYNLGSSQIPFFLHKFFFLLFNNNYYYFFQLFPTA